MTALTCPKHQTPETDAEGYAIPRDCKACDRLTALAELRALCPPGTTVYTILRSVSRSGMSRVITPLLLTPKGPWYLNYEVGLVLGLSHKGDPDGLSIPGGGMDMGFDLVHSLSYALHGTGPEKCSYHDEHRPGYTLNHRWL